MTQLGTNCSTWNNYKERKKKTMETRHDPISGRRIAQGKTHSGLPCEMVEYKHYTHVALLLSNGKWSQFMEPATLDEMVTRLSTPLEVTQ